MRWTREPNAPLLVLIALAMGLVAGVADSKEIQDSRPAKPAMETPEASGSDDARVSAGELDVQPLPTRNDSRNPRGESATLDALLRLPPGFATNQPRAVAGAGESEWRRRFDKADRDLTEARASLEDAKRELDGMAAAGGSSQWSIAPPGGESSPTTSPLSFKLHQRIRNDRERVVVDERAMRQLQIEADLAGVPKNWRGSNPDPMDPDKN